MIGHCQPGGVVEIPLVEPKAAVVLEVEQSLHDHVGVLRLTIRRTPTSPESAAPVANHQLLITSHRAQPELKIADSIYCKQNDMCIELRFYTHSPEMGRAHKHCY